jgi:hypothetical protein
MCTWHALAKLRLHTEHTLDALKKTTVQLGRQLRYFSSFVCPAFKTYETPNELEARARRELKKRASKAKSAGSAVAPQAVATNPAEASNLTPATAPQLSQPSPAADPTSGNPDFVRPDSPKLTPSSSTTNPASNSTTSIQKRRRQDGTFVLVLRPAKRARIDDKNVSLPLTVATKQLNSASCKLSQPATATRTDLNTQDPPRQVSNTTTFSETSGTLFTNGNYAFQQ